MSKPAIAFCGLGIMGSGMAKRLLGAGFSVTLFNRNPQKAAPLMAAGARLASSPAEAARGAELILSMVTDDAASRAVWLGENGALAGASAGATCIEASTVTVDWIKELAAAAKAGDGELLDAPVTGSKAQAAAGELNFLVGGTPGALEKARPALAAMGRSITHLGPTGSGALMKLINNFLCGAQVASLAEALSLIERSGLDRDQALAVLTGGAPGSPLVKTVAARMTAADYTPNFMLRLLAKDLGYAIAESKNASLNLTTATSALELLKHALAEGHGEQDMAAVIEPLRKQRTR